MSRSRKAIITTFLNREGFNTNHNSLSCSYSSLYSYSTPLAMFTPEGQLLINLEKYSATTTRQQNELIAQATQKGISFSEWVR
jgi:hypothetical protein